MPPTARAPLAVALVSAKGGVGKTTTAVNLAYLAATGGQRALLWDLDPQAATTFLLRATNDARAARPPPSVPDVWATDYERLDVVRSATAAGAAPSLSGDAFRRAYDALAPWYDVVLFDCAAGLDAPVADAIAVSGVVLVPVLPSPLGARTLEQVDAFVARRPYRPPVVPFFSMVDRRRRLHRDIVESLQLERPSTLSAQIVEAAVVERMGARMEPVLQFAPDSGVAAAYRALWAELLDRLGVEVGGRSA
jgi:cellulose biosynthesis protein BcsQ